MDYNIRSEIKKVDLLPHDFLFLLNTAEYVTQLFPLTLDVCFTTTRYHKVQSTLLSTLFTPVHKTQRHYWRFKRNNENLVNSSNSKDIEISGNCEMISPPLTHQTPLHVVAVYKSRC